jgi:hypothetical protein
MMVRIPDFQSQFAVSARRKSLLWGFFEKNIAFRGPKTAKT